jgi:adenine-specific DNA methylase
MSNREDVTVSALPTLLDLGLLPVDELAELAQRESYRPRAVYLAHKWFARRFGTAMRALLVGVTLPPSGDFWAAFHGAADLTGLRVVDLFVGGGTSLYEAHRLGAEVVGADIDPVACLVTRFELEAHSRPDPREVLETVADACNEQPVLYQTIGPDGDERNGLHFFWVQQVGCGRCGHVFDAHPDRVLAYGADHQWVLCAGCGEVSRQDKGRTSRRCPCGTTTSVCTGPLNRGTICCPECRGSERLIDHARRTGQRPEFRLFAIESIPRDADGGRPVPVKERILHRATAEDLNRYAHAAAALTTLTEVLPERRIPNVDRSDNRVTDYGYTQYRELFNHRQQLHLARLLQAISGLAQEHQLTMALALSNHLTANCMLTRYSSRWRQVTPLFALRAYTHSARPVELNPWLRGTGRGTYPNAVRKVANAITYAQSPREFTATGYTSVPARPRPSVAVVINGDSRHRPEIVDGSANIVLTDPPYLDNIDYSELSDFYLPWLAAAGQLVDPGGPPSASLAAKGRRTTHVLHFQNGLQTCFREAARMLHPTGRMIFTFQHKSAAAWGALGTAMHCSGLRAVTVLPLRGDGESGLHRHDGSSTWDAVIVLRHRIATNPPDNPGRPGPRAPGLRDRAQLNRCLAHADRWGDRLTLGPSDRLNLRRACVVTGTVGLAEQPPEYPDSTDPSAAVLLDDALKATALDVTPAHTA